MNRDKLTRLRVRPWVIRHLREHPPGGGFQDYKHRLIEKLDGSDTVEGRIVVVFDDQELGELIRHMGYGGGGFQSMLKKVFLSALLRHIGYD